MRVLKKQRGFVLTTELIILTTIITIGSVIGFTLMRDAVVAELLDIADSIEAKQEYAFDGIKNSTSVVNYSSSARLIRVESKVEGSTVRFNTPTTP